MHEGKADSISTLLVLEKSREAQQCQEESLLANRAAPPLQMGVRGQ